MANGYTNTVPLGREGTGSAQILGPNRALQYALQQNQRRENRIADEQQRYQRNQQAYDSQFQRTLFEMGELAQTPMFREDFAELTNDLVRQGGELMAQGVNPFNPYQGANSRAAVQQWTSDYNRLRAAKGVVDNLYKQRQTQVDNYLKNPNDYDFDEFQELKDFEKNVSLDDILNGNANIPQLSKRLNIGEEIGKQFGDVYTDIEEFSTDEAGNPIRVTGRRPDERRIMGIVQNSFNPRTQYGQEVNRRLRREFGEGATMDGLLGTTDRDRIRQILDAEFRNPSDDNPIVELMANGINARPGTPEYESFLEQATNEQLRAERILDDAKQEAATSLVQRVNPTMRQRYDFSLRDQQLQEQAAARSARNSDASYRNTMLDIKKKESGSDSVEDAMIDEAIDVDFSMDYGDGDVEEGITVWGAIPQSTPSISVNQGKSIDVYSGKQGDAQGIRGSITGVGLVGVDKNGNAVNGASPESLVGDSRVVKFVPKIIVQDNKQQSHIYDIGSIPVESLTDRYQENMKKAIAIQKRTATDFNNRISNRGSQSGASSNTKKTPAQLMREAAGQQ